MSPAIPPSEPMSLRWWLLNEEIAVRDRWRDLCDGIIRRQAAPPPVGNVDDGRVVPLTALLRETDASP